MKRALWTACFLMLAIGLQANAADVAPLKLVQSVDLPNYSGDFDHFAADPTGNRLFLAAEDHGTVEMFDLKTGRWVKTLKGFEVPHSILYLPGSARLFITDGGNGMSKILDARSLKVLGTVPLVLGADSIAYDRTAKRVFVVTGGKDAKMKESVVSAIDTDHFKKVGDLKIDSAHVEQMALETHGSRMFINLTDQNQVAVVDREKLKIIDRWPVHDAGENSPIALDEANHRLFIVCRKPAKLVIFDTTTGRQVAALDTAARADEMIFDPAHKRIYVPGGEGYVAVYEQKDPDHYELLAKVPSATGAKTGIFVPELKRLYLAVSPGEEKFGAKVLTFEVE